MQLECNCRKLHRRICNWKNTGKLKQTAYMSLCGWGQWLVMWAFCMTWRCWFCLVPHEEYLSLVCEQKQQTQVEFIRLMAEILHHFWVDGISLHPLNLNIGGSNAGNRRTHEWLKSCTTLDVIPTLKLWGLQGEASKVLQCNTWQAVQDFSHQQYSDRLVALYPQSPH